MTAAWEWAGSAAASQIKGTPLTTPSGMDSGCSLVCLCIQHIITLPSLLAYNTQAGLHSPLQVGNTSLLLFSAFVAHERTASRSV